MIGWCKRHAGGLAIVFAIVAVALLVIVCFQAWMLQSKGWRIAMGSLPEYLAAVGSVSTLGVLALAVDEWRRGQRERRDQLANQARLIVVEAVPRAEMVPPANEAPVRPDGKLEYRYVVIRNRSQEPVFNVRIPDGSQVETKEKMPWVTSVAEVRAQQEVGSFSSPTATTVHLHPPDLVPVLAPGQATFQLYLQLVPRNEQVTESVFFTFTDARGAKWRRLGSEQPEQEFDRSSAIQYPRIRRLRAPLHHLLGRR